MTRWNSCGSHNQVEKLNGIQWLKSLRVLYMSNNLVKDWSKFKKNRGFRNTHSNQFVFKFLLVADWWDLDVMRAGEFMRLAALPPVVRRTAVRLITDFLFCNSSSGLCCRRWRMPRLLTAVCSWSNVTALSDSEFVFIRCDGSFMIFSDSDHLNKYF